ncbi:MAG: TM2 domain-containing protein [Defluviitaleaceae bacterium]|nr:TM2 domain-containing protein [Defluviitaleaceae bacterium]
MPCIIHPEREVHALCETCKEPFCEGCLVAVSGKPYCKAHVAELVKNNRISTPQPPPPPIPQHNQYNNYYGYGYGYNYPYKSRVIALLLCIFLGVCGVHRFYVGKVGTGVLYLFTGGLFVVGWIVDIIRIGTGEFLDSNGHPLV